MIENKELRVEFISPLKIFIYRKKKTKEDVYFTLNLNQYRNSDYHILNQAKINYYNYFRPIFLSNPIRIDSRKPIVIVYELYPSRRCDLSNFCCIIDKFFCDVLCNEHIGVIDDDSYEFIPEVIYRFGGINKENPHCKIMIYQ